jgi:hypothetical protein
MHSKNRTMRKITFLIFTLFTTFTLTAQVPGYQGKRGVLEVQAMPSLLASLVAETTVPIGLKVHGEYAIRRQKSIGLEYRQMSFGGQGSYDSKTVMLLFCTYKDWSLAPYGRYFNYGLGYNMRSVKLGLFNDFQVAKDNYLSAHIAWGQRRIVAKRIALNLGFETGIPLKTDLFGGGTNPFSIDWSIMALNLNLGLGFIF